MVDVAQLVEHQIVALVVAGSSPVVHPKINSAADIDNVGGCLINISIRCQTTSETF